MESKSGHVRMVRARRKYSGLYYFAVFLEADFFNRINPIADTPVSTDPRLMINFRLPWFTLFAGSAAFLLVCYVSLPKMFAFSCALAACLLILDGTLGINVLPMLTPHASFPEHWRAIERRFYLEPLGIIRWVFGAVVRILFGLFFGFLPNEVWQGWLSVTLIVLWACAWILAALKAMRDVLGND